MMANRTTGASKQNAGRAGRGSTAFKAKISKKDPLLQQRMDDVVANAASREAMRDDAKLIVLPNGVKVVVQKKTTWVGATQ